MRPERIAAALNTPLEKVLASMSLLNGIHDEAANMLKDKSIPSNAIRYFKRVTAVRQIEMAEMMVNANNYSVSYAEAMVLGTSKNELAHPERAKTKKGLSAADIARMEEEMETLAPDLKAVEKSYGENVLNLTLARGYIRKLLDNAKVVRFLNNNHADILAEFEAIAAAEAL